MPLKIQNDAYGEGRHRLVYDSANGSCKCMLEVLPGSCSTALLHGWVFYLASGAKTPKFFKQLQRVLVSSKNFDLNRSKLLISAVVGSTLETFAEVNDWTGDESQFNGKSGNHVRIWTFNRGIRA